MNKFRVEMATPEKTFFEGEIVSLSVETSEGRLGILAGHTPMAIGLKPSFIKFKDENGEEHTAVNGEGFVEVGKEKLTILSISLEWPHEIEINKIRKQIEDNERKLKEAKSKVEYKLSKATLTRLFAKLKAVNK